MVVPHRPVLKLLILIALCSACFYAGWALRPFQKEASRVADRRLATKPDAEKAARAPTPGSPDDSQLFPSLLPEDSDFSKLSPVEAVRASFAEANEFRRLQMFHRALRNLRPEHAQAIQLLFDEGDVRGRHYVPEYQYFAQRWGEVDGGAALAHALQRWPGRPYMHGMLANMADGWASQKPDKVVDWLNSEQRAEPWMREAVMEGLVDGLGQKDLALARRFVESQAGLEGTEKLVTLLADKYIYSRSLEEAEGWLRELAPETAGQMKGTLLGHLTDRFLRGGPEQASEFISRHAAAPWMDRSCVRRVRAELEAKDPEAAARWLTSLPEHLRN